MFKKVKIIAITVFTLINTSVFVPADCAEVSNTLKTKQQVVEAASLQIVERPQDFLGKEVKVIGIFDKFSTLGLDYKPAFRDSKDYIAFLIKRDNVTDHTIPLSEFKILIKRDKAEKLIDIESGDKIEFSGKIFSTVLNDPWLEVDSIKILTPKDKKASKAKNSELDEF
jgi:hypothetical protein